MNRAFRITSRSRHSWPRVALLIETSNAYARGLLHGVVGYIREHQPWSFYLLEQGRGDAPPVWLTKWKGDGIIARIENRRIAKAVINSGVPTVDVSSGRYVKNLPWVETDDVAIADAAAEHLLQRGLKNFGYCGDERFSWSRWRATRFQELVQAAGYRCEVLVPPASLQPAEQVAAIGAWLKTLPKPVGVFACYDIRGQQVLDACRSVGLAVPDQVAVLGVDNDELLCELSSPPLSSVAPDTYRTGYEAASLLDRKMRGERVPSLELRVKPLGVRMRQSTDVLATDDIYVTRAVKFIREHACEPIGVNDVIRAVSMSRRPLEARFRKLLNHSPHDEIVRAKLERIKQLLTETELPLDQIAERTGFDHPEYLSVFFKREVGIPPGDFRATQQRSGMRR